MHFLLQIAYVTDRLNKSLLLFTEGIELKVSNKIIYSKSFFFSEKSSFVLFD